MADTWLELLGVISDRIYIGLTGALWKSSSDTLLEARNNADSAFATVRGADPVGDDDLVTFRKLHEFADGAIRAMSITLGTASVTSTSLIPQNAIVLRAMVQIVTPYSANATIDVGSPAIASKWMAGSAMNEQQAGLYVKDQITAQSAAAEAVKATVGGAPQAGAAKIVVLYVMPNV